MGFDLDDDELKATQKKKLGMTIGTTYELNKNLVEKYDDWNIAEREKSFKELSEFLDEYVPSNSYFMLLCHERRDYTIFDLGHIPENMDNVIYNDLKTTLENRGTIKSIGKASEGGAMECWVSIDNESFVYYLFPCDAMVINYEEVD